MGKRIVIEKLKHLRESGQRDEVNTVRLVPPRPTDVGNEPNVKRDRHYHYEQRDNPLELAGPAPPC